LLEIHESIQRIERRQNSHHTSQRTGVIGTEMVFKNENQSGDVPIY